MQIDFQMHLAVSYLAHKIFILKLENKNKKKKKNPEIFPRTLTNYFCICFEKSITHGNLLSFPNTIKKEMVFLLQIFIPLT